jgi:hypothetical protein
MKKQSKMLTRNRKYKHMSSFPLLIDPKDRTKPNESRDKYVDMNQIFTTDKSESLLCGEQCLICKNIDCIYDHNS